MQRPGMRMCHEPRIIINPICGTWTEKAMAPHSSTFAWKIPWTEKPGRLQSMGSLESDKTERLHFHFSLSCTGEGNGNPLQCSCLENPRDGEAWWAAVYGVAQSRTRLKRLSSSSGWPWEISLGCVISWNLDETWCCGVFLIFFPTYTTFPQSLVFPLNPPSSPRHCYPISDPSQAFGLRAPDWLWSFHHLNLSYQDEAGLFHLLRLVMLITGD